MLLITTGAPQESLPLLAALFACSRQLFLGPRGVCRRVRIWHSGSHCMCCPPAIHSIPIMILCQRHGNRMLLRNSDSPKSLLAPSQATDHLPIP